MSERIFKSSIKKARDFLEQGCHGGAPGVHDLDALVQACDQCANALDLPGESDEPAELARMKSELRLIRAQASYHLQRRDVTIQDCTTIINAHGIRADQSAEARLWRSLAHRDSGDCDKEEADVQSVLEMEDAPIDKRVWALRTRGNRRRPAPSRDDASEFFTSIIQREELPPALRAIAHFERASARISGDEQAIEDFEAVVRLSNEPFSDELAYCKDLALAALQTSNLEQEADEPQSMWEKFWRSLFGKKRP